MKLHGVSPANLNRLEYRAPPLIHRLVGRPAVAAMTPGYARLCLPWLAAVTLMRGTVTLDDFHNDALCDPDLLALSKRISVGDTGINDNATFVPATAVATLHDGRRAQAQVSAQLGSPEMPLTEQQHLEKAYQCLGFANLEASHDRLFATINTLEQSTDVAASIHATGISG
jgi:2-methylcitrate dehydratase PrpD